MFDLKTWAIIFSLDALVIVFAWMCYRLLEMLL
jgi:hypothetical protein